MNKLFKIPLHTLLFLTTFFMCLPSLLRKKRQSPKLVWGTNPLINNKYWSHNMSKRGYCSTSVATEVFSINKPSDFDIVINQRFKKVPQSLKYYFFMIYSIYKYDIFHFSFNGFCLQHTPFKSLEASFLHFFKKKTIVIPYGSDLYKYSEVTDISLRHALNLSYPDNAKNEFKIMKQVNYWSKKSDIIIGTAMIDLMPRWDHLYANPLVINTAEWKINTPRSYDFSNRKIKIVHTPNHRGFKGSYFIKNTIQKMIKDGYNIEYIELQGIPNDKVKDILIQSDILIEQLIANCYGLSAIEGMALGLNVISNLEDSSLIKALKRYSFFGECPIHPATVENLEEKIKELISNPSILTKHSQLGIAYVNKYHDGERFSKLLENIYSSIY